MRRFAGVVVLFRMRHGNNMFGIIRHCIKSIISGVTSIQMVGIIILVVFTMGGANTYKGKVGSLPIFLDLDIPKNDGEVRGIYFYQKGGAVLRLEGTKHIDSIKLFEDDLYNKVTGRFLFKMEGGNLIGQWENDHKLLSFVASPFKSALMEQARQKALDDYDLDLLNFEFMADDECWHKWITYYCRTKYIRSIVLNVEGCNYPIGQWVAKNYNTKTLDEITFWDEIDSNQINALKEITRIDIQKQLVNCRAQYPDSVWLQVFSGWNPCELTKEQIKADPLKALDSIFTVKNVEIMLDEFTVTTKGVQLNGHSYFGFSVALSSMDFFGNVEMPFNELQKYLKSDSILRKINK